ncbi:MAG: GNAT family N-acetyltransferase [Chloroflexota bacterium]
MNRTFAVARPRPFSWLDLLIAALGIAGGIVFLSLYDSALPDAAIDVSISRSQAEKIAETTLRDFGYDAEGYKSALSFSSDSNASYYLQRTLGVEETNRRLAAEDWPLYYWSVRWFKPLQKEEFRVYLAPDGRFLGLDHSVEETAPGADIPQAQAQVLAEDFLVRNAGWNPADWEAVESSSETLPGGRTDHTFVWKSNGFLAGESELRYWVIVRGDQVGHVYKYIKVPEAYQRQFATERNNAGLVNGIALALGFLGITGLALLSFRFTSPDFRRAAPPALLVGAVSLAAYLNSLPLLPFSYDTTENYAAFWFSNIVGIALIGLFYTFMVLAIWMLGQAINKLAWPREDKIWARGPMQWVTFSRSALRGLFLGGIQLGYVVLFYLFAQNILGWWSPVTSGYSNIFGTPFPFLFAYEVGLGAAVTEELIFRLIGIGLFLWMFRGRGRWLALLIPAVIWASAHTGYVSYPIYARGVELTIVAIMLGLVFLKFDLTTTLMSHFTYNMMVVGIILLRSSEPYYQASGWIVVATLAVPLLPGLIWAWRRAARKEPPLPTALTLAPICEADLSLLAALPLKADWPALLNQTDRSTFCLKGGGQLIGVVSGCMRDGRGWVDGLYVVEAWRRQSWASRMLAALREEYQARGVAEMRAVLSSRDVRALIFFSNQSWQTHAVLTAPLDESSFGTAIKEIYITLFRKKDDAQLELEFPQKNL